MAFALLHGAVQSLLCQPVATKETAFPRRLFGICIIGLLLLLSTAQSYWVLVPYVTVLSSKPDTYVIKQIGSEESSGAERLPSNQTNRTNVLIAQYSSGYAGKYNLLMNLTKPINQLYAERWGYDYYALRGPPPGLIAALASKNASFTESRSTYFKVLLLDDAIEQGIYDYMVLLDADAIFYDFERDIAQLIPDNKLLVAHKVRRDDVPGTGNVNIGVTLWNLRHPAASWLVNRWKKTCCSDDDQTPLQRILKRELTQVERDSIVQAVSKEFSYGKGTFIKHFIRAGVDEASVERRVSKIQRVWEEVCPRYALKCSSEYLNFTWSPP
jgi:hypothetical protein